MLRVCDRPQPRHVQPVRRRRMECRWPSWSTGVANRRDHAGCLSAERVRKECNARLQLALEDAATSCNLIVEKATVADVGEHSMRAGVRTDRHPGILQLPDLIPRHVVVLPHRIRHDEERRRVSEAPENRQRVAILTLPAVVEGDYNRWLLHCGPSLQRFDQLLKRDNGDSVVAQVRHLALEGLGSDIHCRLRPRLPHPMRSDIVVEQDRNPD